MSMIDTVSSQRVRGGQHPLDPALPGAGQGQDSALVHVRHRHCPAPHGRPLYCVISFAKPTRSHSHLTNPIEYTLLSYAYKPLQPLYPILFPKSRSLYQANTINNN